jgi:hypothetical protein
MDQEEELISPQVIERNRELAKRLRGQSDITDLSGQMVSGWYVPPSPTQYLAKLIAGYKASQEEDKLHGLEDKKYAQDQAVINALKKKKEDWLNSAPGMQAAPVAKQEVPTLNIPGNSQSSILPMQAQPVANPIQQQPAMQQAPQPIGQNTLGAQQGIAPQASANPQGKIPSSDEYLRWAMKGLSVDPDTANMGFKMADTISAREWRDQQAAAELNARREESKLRAEQRMQELQMRLEDQRLARADRESLAKELISLRASMGGGGGGGSPVNQQLIQTENGALAWNPRTNKIEPVMYNGQPVRAAQYNPELAGQISQARAGATVSGKLSAEAAGKLPGMLQKAEEATKYVNDLLTHPGFQDYVGATWLPGAQYIPGTDASNFKNRLNQVKSGAFLNVIENLRGLGAMTEMEGSKATQAINRMDGATSEAEFKEAAKDYINKLNNGIITAREMAAGAMKTNSPAQPAPKFKIIRVTPTPAPGP